MKLNRRSFLFGSAAAFGAIALAPHLEPIVWQDAGYKKRVIHGLGIGGLEDGEGLLHAVLKRWPTGTSILDVSVHPRVAYRCWFPPGSEPIFTDKSLMLIEAIGHPSQINISGQDDGVWFGERYTFPGPHKERWLWT